MKGLRFFFVCLWSPIILAVIYASVSAMQPLPMLSAPEGAKIERVASLVEGKRGVQVFRAEYNGEICYHTVGWLHGWTISVDCLEK